MTERQNPVYEIQAEIFKAIGHPIRLQIVKYLQEGEHTVTEIVKAVGAEQSNVSRHLGLLRQTGVLSSRKEGLKVFYSLRIPDLGQMLSCVNEVVRSRLKDNESVLSSI
jgi:ArsR family transcriptional regulator